MKTFHAIEVRTFPAQGNKGPRIRLTSLHFPHCRRMLIYQEEKQHAVSAARGWLENCKGVEVVGYCETPRGWLLISSAFERFVP